MDWQCCLAGSSKRAPKIFIFSIALGAENLSYIKSIETYARTFLPLNILAVGSVVHVALSKRPINQFKPVHQSRQLMLRDYCHNIYKLCLYPFQN